MKQISPVDAKLRETKFHLERLVAIESAKEFYPVVNAFLSSARSVLSVARHELGWRERLSHHRVGLTPVEEAERRSFDEWFESSADAKAVLDHPLTDERNRVVHRGGQARFGYFPKHFDDMIYADGDAFRPPVAVGSFKDANTFHYYGPGGTSYDAVPYCKRYFKLVETFCRRLKRTPWRRAG
jgi:hypothetical protein